MATKTTPTKRIANPFSQYGRLEEQPLSGIEPGGWLRAYLEKQVDGLTGNVQRSGHPYTTLGWANKGVVSIRRGSDWWPYEQTAYYLTGALRCGYLIDSKPLIERVQKNIQAVLDHPKAAGRLGPRNVENDSWPMVVLPM